MAFLFMRWKVYILFSKCLDRYYIGCTSNINERFDKHHSKFYGNSAFTAKADDWQLMLSLPCLDEQQAKTIEAKIKKMKSKVYIANLIHYPEMQQKLLSY